MPTQADGLINEEDACRWILRALSPHVDNGEYSRARWNARLCLEMLESARQRGEDDSQFGEPLPD